MVLLLLLAFDTNNSRLRSPDKFLEVVHRHYDLYPHQQSGGQSVKTVTVALNKFTSPGLPMEVLAQDFWVPGSTVRAEQSKYINKEIFAEILVCTDETACLYATRASDDFRFGIMINYRF